MFQPIPVCAAMFVPLTVAWRVKDKKVGVAHLSMLLAS